VSTVVEFPPELIKGRLKRGLWPAKPICAYEVNPINFDGEEVLARCNKRYTFALIFFDEQKSY
jgi:hypothetical protein